MAGKPMGSGNKLPGPGFHVFSIRPAGGSGPENGSSGANTKQYITRKSHRKSRLGCMPCKYKRVKCDEQQPVCGRCERTNSKCDYHQLPAASDHRLPKSEPVEHGSSISPGIPDVSIPIPRSIEKGSRDLHLLKHYDTITGGGVDTITCSDLLVGSRSREYRMNVLRLGQQYSYLLHGMLAVAALHLDHFQVQGYRLAKLSHLQVALTDFQNAINAPIAKREADPILLTAMMLTMQYFCYVDSTDPLDSWVFSGDPSRLDWLTMQTGLLPLVQSTSQWHGESLLAPVWALAVYERDARQGLPEALLRLCGVHEKSKNLHRNPYYNALQSLAPLMLVEHSTNNLIKYLSCINSFDKRFSALIQRNDPRALLILAYWFGLMCYVDFWWCRRRVQRDSTALCMYLDQHGDERIKALLRFPADCCGYRLQHITESSPVDDDFDITVGSPFPATTA